MSVAHSCKERKRRGFFQALLGSSWLSELRTNVALGAWHIKQISPLLKKSCKVDKVQYLQKLAVDVEHSRPCDMQAAVRKLLQPKKK